MSGNPAPSQGKLVVLVGPAGAGKTTLAHRVIDNAPQMRGFSVSHTTRPIRMTETDGADYHFVARPVFESLRDQGGFVEWAEVHGNLYGTSRAELERLTGAGRTVFFDVDIVGAHNLWRQYPQQTRLVFVLAPSWPVLVDRLTGRGTETDATLRRRLRTARTELQELLVSPAPWWIVHNDMLDDAVAQLEAVVGETPPPPSEPRTDATVAAALQAAMADRRADDQPGQDRA